MVTSFSPPAGSTVLDFAADLHLHSLYSDGVFSPSELVRAGAKRGLKGLALTDHDTVAGVAEFQAEAEKSGIQALPGVELSAFHRELEVHILGYAFNPQDQRLLLALERFAHARKLRMEKMVQNLRALHLDLTMEQVSAAAGKGPLGRPHLAEAMLRAGLVKSFDEAFSCWIGKRSPAYVEKYRLSGEEAIELIHQAGGVAVIAHPLLGRMSREDLVSLLALGLDGIEVQHPKLLPEQAATARRLAEERGLLISGGSDFHGGSRSEAPIGHCAVPFAWVDRIQQKSAVRSAGPKTIRSCPSRPADNSG